MPKFGPPFYKQETPDSCLPACLRMVLAARGRRYTERYLRRLCHKPQTFESAWADADYLTILVT